MPPNDPAALGRRIEEVLGDPERMATMSAQNLATAQEYRSAVLQQRRVAFYEVLRNRTAEWLTTRSRPSLGSRDCVDSECNRPSSTACHRLLRLLRSTN